MSGLNLDPEQLDRYSRHIIMDEVGPTGQQRLLDSAVLVIGAGGLGSPILQYLAAVGVGTIGIVDDDVVEVSNLHRQILHGVDDVGRSKVESATDSISRINPHIDVVPHETRLTPENAESIIDAYDFVVDGTDNFRTRYLVNDACTIVGLPYSYGAIYKFEGQAATFSSAPDSPCYRCLFPEAPPEGMIPDCATAGVLGVLPGTIGCIQATETIKAIIQQGALLDGRLLHFDALQLSFDEVQIQKNPDCPVCGEAGIDSVEEVDYVSSCAVSAD